MFADIGATDGQHQALVNDGLAYLLLRAWQLYRDEGTALDGVGVHPAVAEAARLRSAEPAAGSLTQIASAAGISPGHLSRLFKAQTGIALGSFRNRQRLIRFLLTYRGGKHPTALDAAHAAGFGSYAQFYRVCRQVTGHPRQPSGPSPLGLTATHRIRLRAPAEVRTGCRRAGPSRRSRRRRRCGPGTGASPSRTGRRR